MTPLNSGGTQYDGPTDLEEISCPRLSRCYRKSVARNIDALSNRKLQEIRKAHHRYPPADGLACFACANVSLWTKEHSNAVLFVELVCGHTFELLNYDRERFVTPRT